jgi:hypothetical protein
MLKPYVGEAAVALTRGRLGAVELGDITPS